MKTAGNQRNIMSDNSRRLICRSLFILLCLIPTSAVAYFSLHQPTAHHWQQRIQATLGIDISIDSVETPKPGQTILRGVSLLDPTAADPIRITEIAMQYGNVNRIHLPEKLSLEPEKLAEIVSQIHNRALQPTDLITNWQIFVDQFAFKPPSHSNVPDFVVENVVVDVQLSNQGAQIDAAMTAQSNAFLESAHPESQGDAAMANDQIICGIIAPDRTITDKTAVYFHSKQANVPAWIASGFLPELTYFGNECRCRGRLDLNVGPRGDVGGELNDFRIENIQIADLKYDSTLPINGTATASFDKAWISESQFKSLENGTFNIEGSVSSKFLHSAANHLNLATQRDFSRPDYHHRLFHYQAKFGFNIDGSSVKLRPLKDTALAHHATDHAELLVLGVDERGNLTSEFLLENFARFWIQSNDALTTAKFLSRFGQPQTAETVTAKADPNW